MRNPRNWATVALALAADGRSVGVVGVEVTRGAPPLSIFLVDRVDADPTFRKVSDWLLAAGSDLRRWPLYEPGSRNRRRLLVDVTDRGASTTLQGRLLGMAVYRSPAVKRWTPQLALVDQVSSPLPGPEYRGGYLAVARVDVMGRASQALAAGAAGFAPGIGLAKEAAEQIAKLRSQKDKDDPAGTGGDLATALVLALWDSAWAFDSRRNTGWR